MTFVLQHGHGKSDKIEFVAENTRVSSVVLSPTDENPENLGRTAKKIKESGIRPLIDPQTYLYTEGVNLFGRLHNEHGIDFRPIRWSQSPRDVESVIAAVTRMNDAAGVGDIIAPSILQPSFEDIWTPIGIQYARAAAEAWPGRRVYASVVFDEMAFAGWEQINNWMDEITTIDVTGFYLLTNHRASIPYPATMWDVDRLTNVLRMIYTLTEINDYQLIWGYSDLEGLLGVAAGATGVATGWYNSLRRFSTNKWQPQSGCAQPIPRRFVTALLSSLRLDREVSAFPRDLTGFSPLNSTADALFYDDIDDSETWRRPLAQKHHLISIGELTNRLVDMPNPAARLDALGSWLDNSIELFEALE